MRRPLTPQQIEYAAKDVKYLLPCYEQLAEEQGCKERLSGCWKIASGLSACQKQKRSIAIILSFNRVGIWISSRCLCCSTSVFWRERRLVSDFAHHIVKDGSLFEIAEEKQPHSVKGLLKLTSLRGKSRDIRHMKQFAHQILDQVQVLEDRLDETKEHAANSEGCEHEAPRPIERPLDRFESGI